MTPPAQRTPSESQGDILIEVRRELDEIEAARRAATIELSHVKLTPQLKKKQIIRKPFAWHPSGSFVCCVRQDA